MGSWSFFALLDFNDFVNHVLHCFSHQQSSILQQTHLFVFFQPCTLACELDEKQNHVKCCSNTSPPPQPTRVLVLIASVLPGVLLCFSWHVRSGVWLVQKDAAHDLSQASLELEHAPLSLSGDHGLRAGRGWDSSRSCFTPPICIRVRLWVNKEKLHNLAW